MKIGLRALRRDGAAAGRAENADILTDLFTSKAIKPTKTIVFQPSPQPG
jgi:hypothetical protein